METFNTELPDRPIYCFPSAFIPVGLCLYGFHILAFVCQNWGVGASIIFFFLMQICMMP